ncbi:MAG: hypothetical protein [Circular genetic element sp.]|nr:MAG: hypothetical protein [Circular genetic element sp.]
MNTDYYVDNNGRIQVCVDQLDTSVSVGGYHRIHLALSNLTDLTGQSTVFVNKLKFSMNTISPSGGSTDYFVGHILAGIIPLDMAGSNFDTLVDYKNVKGWPIPMSKQYIINSSGHPGASDVPFVGRLSQTYTPKSTLLINREQAIQLSFKNDYGDNQQVNLSIQASLARGE